MSLRPKFWEKYAFDKLTPQEWEALCDGCGKCCLNKLEDEDSGVVVFTRVACRLLDDETCRCSQYEIRRQFVPECIVLTPKTLPDVSYFMPHSCAYRRMHEGRGLADWHPLVSGDADSVHKAGISMQGQTVPEFEVPEEEWEHYLIEEQL
ncbi:YcgN family cysteine cluster protein [Halocynthiibacter namhaensis]|uniref:YcgN family cysteine cluster protein n=1 Tax=Halocynthiibacter namhaensis TaxID=1290553 RepID=UPI0005795E33|nr:YcgN family cysteine cluster protein [Halocynthiibacter namhaensis]